MFRETLQKAVDRLEGGVAGILMGFDGISVESFTKPKETVDIQTVGMELAHAIVQVRKASDQLEVGALREIALRTEGLTVIVHLLNDEYFIALAVKPEGNLGKARYLMRILAPQIQSQL